MMPQSERLTAYCREEVRKQAGKNDTSVDLVGPTLVIAPDENMQPQPQIGWQVTVYLKHNKLLGQPPVTSTMPLPGLIPVDLDFKRVVTHLLQKAMEGREEANNKPMAAQDIPAGLVGKRL